jgi:hypothetical protein
MISLTEAQIEDIREITKHRAELRKKMEVLRANRGHFKQVEIIFRGEGGELRMSQGVRGGLLEDMLVGFEQHLIDQEDALTQKLERLGVRVA